MRFRTAGFVFAILALAVVFAVFRLRRKAPEPMTVASAAPPLARPAKANFEIRATVYDGKFGAGWEDWGWGPRSRPDGGPIGIEFQGYGGIVLHHATLQPEFGAVAFRFRAPPDADDFLTVALRSGELDETVLPKVPIVLAETAELSEGWSEAVVPMTTLNPTGVAFDRIVIQASHAAPSGFVALDKIVLTGATSAMAAPALAARSVAVTVHCDQSAVRISPLIYGTADPLRATFATAHRYGGNLMSRMNWDLGLTNTGSDWYFENGKGSGSEMLYAGFDDDHAHGWKTALVVPMIGWVSKDATSVGFPISKLGPQRSHDPNRPEAGDGHRANGDAIAPGAPNETSVAAPPELIKKWIDGIRRRDAAKGSRSVDEYILDNEPNLWNSTHRDIHPDPVSYDEVLDRTSRYGSAIRAADPDAVIAGPAEWGWSGFFYSAKDLANGGKHDDRRAHGDVPLLPWYLKRLAENEKKTGTRILDVVDVHFYPQTPGLYGNGAKTDPESAALRIRSTRALWDPTYKDESWIADTVNLIPRVKGWIADNYPGRGISLGEWSFGADDHMSGGLAMAETLGHLGQLGVTSAYYWLGPKAGSPGFNAFRAYRNFDGKGGSFLDLSVPTTAAQDLSLFASRDETSSHVVLVLLNLDPKVPADTEIDVSTCGTSTSRRRFGYEAGATGFVDQGPRTEDGTLHEKIAPYSIEVLDVTILKRPTN